MQKFIFILLLSWPYYIWACLPSEIHVREQWIKSYIREDGTKVSAHMRSEHCRKIEGNNYFQNATAKSIKGLEANFKTWRDKEKSVVNTEIKNLPLWLKKYKLQKVLRATVHKESPKNPAMIIPATKTLILFDQFFQNPNKKNIIIHEMAHIAIWDIPPYKLKEFFESNGWKYNRKSAPIPPIKTIRLDSKTSPSEDFANWVESYYLNPKNLKAFNKKSFLILQSIIQIKEKEL